MRLETTTRTVDGSVADNEYAPLYGTASISCKVPTTVLKKANRRYGFRLLLLYTVLVYIVICIQ